MGTTAAASGIGIAPVEAAPNAALQLVKKVDEQDAHRNLVPGQSVTYRIEFSAENYDVDGTGENGAVTLTDVLPAEFAGWAISDVFATLPGNAGNVAVDLPGVTPETGGTIGSTDAERTITVDITAPTDDGLTGLPTGQQGWLSYTVTVPENLSPNWPSNGADLVNTAKITGLGGATNSEISKDDTAVISVDVKRTVDVTPAKTWDPASQGFEPGAISTITIGATQASNVPAESLVLQDLPSATDGATKLGEDNPFRYVDFAGFTGDPSATLPQGATDVEVEVYAFADGEWNWVTYADSIDNADIAGVRLSYTGEIVPGATVSQPFTVTQREEDRLGLNNDLSKGYDTDNKVDATVTVTGEPSVTKTADAVFAVTPMTIAVEADKVFVGASGGGVDELQTVAGNRVNAILTAKNLASPLSATLDSLTITEPAEGSDERYFSADLEFAGFDASYTTQVWPAGATAGTITWQYLDGTEVKTQTETLTPGEALPAVPAPLTNAGITGFELEFTGKIVPGALSQVKYAINTDENLAGPGEASGRFLNVIDVEGVRNGIDEPATDSDDANLIVVAPAVEVTVKKKVSPSVVLPGDSVIVQLPTTATASGDLTKPTEIVVEDKLTGDGTFWDAYNVTEVLAPIEVPTGGTLVIERFDSVLEAWVTVTTLTDSSSGDIAIAAPETTTGVRFSYTKADGFGRTTSVKPNLKFEARPELRSGGTTTPNDEAPFAPTEYENTVTASTVGKLEDREVLDDDKAKTTGAIRDPEWANGVGTGGLWADKSWADEHLVTQSGATSSTTQRWAVTQPGFDSVTLTDPAGAETSTNGVGTVFEAFNLTRVAPVTFESDPQLKWDTVTGVQLWNGTDWVAPVNVPASSSWMDANGFVGYTLTADEQLSTLGVRLVLAPNDDAREAAIAGSEEGADGDLGVPAVGSGIAASAAERSYTLDWQLRDKARPDSANKWVISDNVFNCLTPPAAEADAGCVDNTFEVSGQKDGTDHTARADDEILLLDGVPNVSLVKTVGGLHDGENLAMVVPKHGDVAPADYPTTWYTLTAKNASGQLGVDPELGIMKLGKIRVTDEATEDIGHSVMGESPFAGRNFADEVTSLHGNHFDRFNVTKLSFEDLPAFIDPVQSEVELWLYNEGAPTTEKFTIEQILPGGTGGPTAEQLADTIGVSVTYQGTSPEVNGNSIIAGEALTLRMDVQLRAEHRVSQKPVTGGKNGAEIPVRNQALALGQDLVVDDTAEPDATDTAQVDLTEALLDVVLNKAITNDGSGENLLEATPQTPVNVVMTATPGGTKTPLSKLTVEDTTEEFWAHFELVALPAPATSPSDTDQYAYDFWVDGEWIEQDAFTGELTEVLGVRITFDREDGKLFPLGAGSWSSDWGSAQLPLTVKLREDNSVVWNASEIVDNVASTTAYGTDGAKATDEAEASIGFETGSKQITVQKRAPLDATTHQVESLVSMPWQLILKNSGTGYLPLETVTDHLPADLMWDGEAPTYSRTGDVGATIDPAEIGVELSDNQSDLVFTWPVGTRMAPGEEITINLGLILQPGLKSAEQAWNSVVVETGVELDRCTQPTNNGQDASKAPQIGETECANANYVTPRAGTLIGAQKFVNGEYKPTLGEDLVTGAMNIKKPEVTECVSPGAPFDYTRTQCADYTAVGGVDNWLLRHANAGTNDLERMVVVDMLPTPDDLLLVGGPAPRNSTFRPIIDLDSFVFHELPENAIATIDLTTDATACVGDGSGPSLWTSADPYCENTTTNPGNAFWVNIDDFDGNPADVAGFRVSVDMQAKPLAPGEWVSFNYDTVNRVVDQAEQGLKPSIAQFQTPQFAWNQNGVFAWDTRGVPINLVKAPQPAGVTLKTGSLEVSKTVEANGVTQIPEAFEVALECTVPSGIADPERVALDMGDQATLMLPADGTSVRVDGLPIGTNCEISETGELGSNGEIGRSFQVSDGVNPSVDGQTAEIKIREPRAADEATIVGLTNTYALGELVIEKSVRSDNEYDLDKETLAKSFDFELSCVANGAKEPITHNFTLKSGEQYEVKDLPQGAVCELTELTDGGANSVNITVNNTTVEAKQLGDLTIGEAAQHVLVSNGFLGEKPEKPNKPEKPGVGGSVEGASDANGTGGPLGTNNGGGLETTGGEIAGLVAAAIVLLGLGAGALALSRRRRA